MPATCQTAAVSGKKTDEIVCITSFIFKSSNSNHRSLIIYIIHIILYLLHLCIMIKQCCAMCIQFAVLYLLALPKHVSQNDPSLLAKCQTARDGKYGDIFEFVKNIPYFYIFDIISMYQYLVL